MYIYIYLPDIKVSVEGKEGLADVMPMTFNKPLSKQAMKEKRLRFYRRGYIEVLTPDERDVADEEERKENGWEE